MTPPTHHSSHAPEDYGGRILGGGFGPELTAHLSLCLRRIGEADALDTPFLYYIAAWHDDGSDIWYEFASRAFIRLFNATSENLAGRFRSSVRERRVYSFQPPEEEIGDRRCFAEDLHRNRKAFRASNVAAGRVEAVYRVEPDPGRFLWLKDHAVIRHFESDRICLSSGMLMDVSLEMTVEARLREETVALETARDAADADYKAKSRFFAHLSHEIRSPLSGLLNLCDLLGNTPLDNRQREYVRLMKQSGATLRALVNDVLDHSRIEAGKLAIRPEPFLLRTVFEDLIDLFLERTAGSEVEFIVDISPEVPEQLIGDALRLRQVLVNLVDNAFKFTRKGEILVGVNRANHVDDAVELRFQVSDTGEGVSPDLQGNLFDAFTSADRLPDRQHEGSGLGLSICRQLVELMDGQIGVASRPGAGATFWFTARFQIDTGEMSVPLLLPERLKGIRVLIVEDNRSTRHILCRMVDSLGATATATESAEEAIQTFENAENASPADMILLDLGLPGMDGVSMVENLRKRFGAAVPPVVAVSAFGRDHDIRRTEEAGIAGFLVKPVKKTRLAEAIAGALPATGESVDWDALESWDGFCSSATGPVPGFPGSSPAVNLEAAMARFHNDRRLFARVVEEFRLRYDAAPDRLRTLVEAGDFDAARSVARTVVSAADNISAMALAEAARNLETACTAGDAQRIHPAMTRFEAAHAEFLTCARQLAST